jgi:hypothetical protein
MSTTEDTSVIDEKKLEETKTSPDFKSFTYNYTYVLIFIIGIGIFFIGTLGLYTTKVAQANILPDDIELAPYTVIDRIVETIPIDINIMKPSFFADSKECLSQKAVFNSKEYLDSFNNRFFCSFKKSADPNAGIFANIALYFSNVYDNIIAKNFLAINTIFLYLSYLPESLIMLLYGIFGIFLWIGLYFFNLCISIFYHFLNIPQLFRTTSEQNDKQWESTENISLLRFMKLILFFFVWSWIGLLSTFIMPVFFTLYGLFAPLFANYKIKGTEDYYNCGSFLWSTLYYKKFFFFILATISLFNTGIKYLGTNSIVAILVAVIFAYFMGLYANPMPEVGDSGFMLGIKKTVKQAELVSNTNILVDLCQQIPIDDTKMEEIIKKGKFRELTKPKTSGGENRVTKNIQNTEVNKETKQKLLDEAIQIKDSFEKLPDDIKNTEDGKKLQQKIKNVDNEIESMRGGKRINKNSVNPNKKYNIRWT